MDIRQELSKNSVLMFGDMQYVIKKVISRGTNAIAYEGLSIAPEKEEKRVLIREFFPHQKSKGIRRENGSGICVDEGKPLAFFLMHKANFEAENDVCRSCLKGDAQEFGVYEQDGTQYTVTDYSGGRTLEEETAFFIGEDGLKRCVQRMVQLLEALSAFHERGYLHLDVSIENVLLIGWAKKEKMLLIGGSGSAMMGKKEIDHLCAEAEYCAPEVELGEEDAICAASDLYSVASVFYRCLTGRNLTLEETLCLSAPSAARSPLLRDAPEEIRAHVRRILKKGLSILPEDRWRTAKQMKRDFENLLEKLNRERED